MVLYQLTVLPNIHTFEEVPTTDPELSYAKNYQQVPVCFKEVRKKKLYRFWSVVHYLQMYM